MGRIYRFQLRIRLLIDRDIHEKVCYLGLMYRVCSVRLGLNFVVRLVAEKNFYLRLMVNKLHAFTVLPLLVTNLFAHS